MDDPSTADASVGTASFRERADEVSGSIWRCLRRFGVPAADVEDCFQGVLIQLHRKWDKLGLLPAEDLRRYAACVAIGVARGAARSRMRKNEHVSDTLGEEIAVEANPESITSRQQELAQLDAILATLPVDRREVFVLYELEGLSGPEIAEYLGLPVGTVSSRLRRARADFEAAAARLQARSTVRKHP